MLIANDTTYVYNLRFEVIERLIREGYEVVVVCERQLHADEIKETGAVFLPMTIKRHSKNPFTDLSMIHMFHKMIRKHRPDIVLTYNIKPNVYAGLVCEGLHIPYITNITGLGMAVEYPGLIQKVTVLLYRIALRKAACVFFQNRENKEFFVKRNIRFRRSRLIPGSGVNLEKYCVLEYPNTEEVHFIFVARILKEKGIDQYLEAAREIHKKHENVYFHVIGGCDDKEYIDILQKETESGNIVYHGLQKNMLEYQKMSSCIILPSYYPEGMNNVLLESAASGRPIITTSRSGCGEIVEDGVTGFIVKEKDTRDLVCKIEKFLAMPCEERKEMGLAGRRKVEREFDREIVVQAYVDEIKRAEGCL